jgi:hypothetical protein
MLEQNDFIVIADLGIKHFTEGLRWSSSYNLLHPTREANLFLLQNLGISFLLSPPADVNNVGFVGPSLDFLIINEKNKSIYRNSAERHPPRDWDPLYSVWVETDNGRRKWHLSKSPSYFLFACRQSTL